MTKVVAAIDNSAAAGPVLATAAAVAELFGADVEAIHARAEGDRVAHGLARPEGAPLQEVPGPPEAAILAAATSEDVVAVVVGARGTPGGRRPVGSTAFAVITGLEKPVVVVPPDAVTPERLARVLVPLEGTAATSHAPAPVVELAHGRAIEVVAVHVHDEASLPSFTDQPQHEAAAWAEEFLARYSPWGVEAVRLETRVGRRDEEVLAAAVELGADVIALGWTRELAPGRAEVVRAVLEHARIPVVLMPLGVSETGPEPAEGSTRLQSSAP
jgi:nucleotide-binding universal stress UspA family protein